MKNYLIAFLAFAASSAFAETKTIDQVMGSLGNWAEGGISVEKVEGASAKEMLRYYAEKIDQAEDGFKVIDNFYGKEMPGVDDGGDTYGVIGTKTARDAFESYVFSEKTPTEKQKKAMTAMFLSLQDLGAKFAYGPNGASVCGSTWPALFVLDLKAKKIYLVNFVTGPC